ncbi:hypothetical protein jhhlp_000054 [Lomentospora prolificans]|uniref:Suppressor of anucleate metulae protein B n=1 Tax=Lomentospora prolificans TaxID=41688 RepID=A0A2N3NLG4_9PEZI|nr:hypothetical protein jhhlp_000054 [Lomentospora prolificans]
MAKLKAKKNKGKKKKKGGQRDKTINPPEITQHGSPTDEGDKPISPLETTPQGNPIDEGATDSRDGNSNHLSELLTIRSSEDESSTLLDNPNTLNVAASISGTRGTQDNGNTESSVHDDASMLDQMPSQVDLDPVGDFVSPSEANQAVKFNSSADEHEPGAKTFDASDNTEGSVDVPLHWITGVSDHDKSIYAQLCIRSSEFDKDCTFCWTTTNLKCEGCGARFCRRGCRDLDWKFHKRVCSKFGGLDPGDRPSRDHFLAILLPMKTREPELIWCRLLTNNTKLRVIHPEISDLYKQGTPPVGNTIHANGSRGTARAILGHGLAMVDAYALIHTSVGLKQLNRCIHSLTAPGALAFHKGPWIAFAFEPDEFGRPRKGIDVIPRDWRHVVDHIIYDPSNPFFGEPPRTRRKDMTFGVKLSNTDNVAISIVMGIEKPLEDVYVPVFDWPNTGPSVLAFQLGLPWKVRYIRGGKSMNVAPHMRYLKQYFRREYGADASQWAAMEEDNVVTFVIFSIGVNRIVHSEHVTAFNKYLDFSLKKKIVPSRDGFMAYWERHRQVLEAKTNRNVIATPYHGPPNLKDLIRFDAEDDEYRRGVMNLMGHFASQGFKMAVREENGVFVPDNIVVRFNAEGSWNFGPELHAQKDVNFLV